MNSFFKELIAKWEHEADDLQWKKLQKRVADQLRDCIEDLRTTIRLIEADQILKGKK